MQSIKLKQQSKTAKQKLVKKHKIGIKPHICCALYNRATAFYHWLRSGNNNNTNNDNALYYSGDNSNGNVNNWLSVRPALHSMLVEFCKNFNKVAA